MVLALPGALTDGVELKRAMAVRGDRPRRARGVPDPHDLRHPPCRAVPGCDPGWHGAARLCPAGDRPPRRGAAARAARRHSADRRGRRRTRARPRAARRLPGARRRPRHHLCRPLRGPGHRRGLGCPRRRRSPSPGRRGDASRVKPRCGRLRACDQTAGYGPAGAHDGPRVPSAGLFFGRADAALVTAFDRGRSGSSRRSTRPSRSGASSSPPRTTGGPRRSGGVPCS